jgi:hypothetical protein
MRLINPLPDAFLSINVEAAFDPEPGCGGSGRIIARQALRSALADGLPGLLGQSRRARVDATTRQ